jgi:pimeloyl-ACP methyl ester carboxylesterase/UDP:flavonoid glycosyltransferase YjiC (YdhE family)
MYAENSGVKIWYDIHGQGEPTLVMVHGFQIAHSEFFKRTYAPFLSRHLQVVTLDLRGNGRSDRPSEDYDLETYVEDVHAVVEAAGLSGFALLGESLGVPIAIQYNATHPGLVSHLISVGGLAQFVRSDDYPHGAPKEALEGALRHWKKQPDAALKGFLEIACSEAYSLRDKELCWEWAHETSAEILAMGWEAVIPVDVRRHLPKTDIPALIVHAEEDKVVFPAAAEYLHRNIPGSQLIVIPESGHNFIRTWPQVSRHILTFLKPEIGEDLARKPGSENPRILWISCPVGLGHATRDLAIVNEMRKHIPDLTVEWLAVDPARSFLEAKGEQTHAMSDALWDECREFECHAEGHTLDATESVWEMDKLLNHNFMVFTDAVRNDTYDLVVADDSFEVPQYLHYNPSLKTAPFVFITDFAGASNVSENQTKQAHVHDFNGIWVEMRQIHPEASDLSLFIGELEDVPDTSFGEGLPNRRQWTNEHFEFIGYILPFDPTDYANREALRTELGFSPGDQVLLVAVGGTSAGRPLIEKCLTAQASLREMVPAIRTVVLCGSRIDPTSFGRLEGVEFLPFTPDPIKLYAACDLAVVQGGLSTTTEFTALKRPFLYFPLKDHFEQQQFVDFRLKRYKAGVRMDFDRTSPSQLAEAIVANIGAPVNYRPVNTDGAKKAASMIIELLSARAREHDAT